MSYAKLKEILLLAHILLLHGILISLLVQTSDHSEFSSNSLDYNYLQDHGVDKPHFQCPAQYLEHFLHIKYTVPFKNSDPVEKE